jgi:hypothetical protein
MDANEIKNKVEQLAKQIEDYDIGAKVTGEQYEHERRIGTLGHALETKKFINIYLSQGRQIRSSMIRDLETALEATK